MTVRARRPEPSTPPNIPDDERACLVAGTLRASRPTVQAANQPGLAAPSFVGPRPAEPARGSGEASRGPRWFTWLGVSAALAGALFLIEPAREPGVQTAPTAPARSAFAPPGATDSMTAGRPETAAQASASFAGAGPAAPPELAAKAEPPEPLQAQDGRLSGVPVRSRFEIATDIDATIDRRLVGELARALAPQGTGLGVLPSLDWMKSLAGREDETRLAIVRYDALQAARTTRPSVPLEILMPFHTDPIAFVVPANSPLRFIHEIENRRINVGPAGSAGALTAATVYERLFGKTLAPTTTRELAPAAALRALRTDSLDVMAVVGAVPAAWQGVPGLKLLALDPGHPASRRVLQAFLPTTTLWPGGETSTQTLAVMSFLVGTAAADPAEAQRLTEFARDLCRALPMLQREGNPKWQAVQPGLRLEVGWPYSAAAAAGLRECSNSGRAERPGLPGPQRP